MSAETDERGSSPPLEAGDLKTCQTPFWQERLLLTVAIIVLALDQLSKVIIVNILPADPGRQDSPVAEEFYKYHKNKWELRKARSIEEREKLREELKPLQGKFEVTVIEGFFSIIHRTNDGAAFSILRGKNGLLAVISVIALVCLIRFRHHFDYESTVGRYSFGLLIGGILGNMVDRITRKGVVDFIEIFIFVILIISYLNY